MLLADHCVHAESCLTAEGQPGPEAKGPEITSREDPSLFTDTSCHQAEGPKSSILDSSKSHPCPFHHCLGPSARGNLTSPTDGTDMLRTCLHVHRQTWGLVSLTSEPFSAILVLVFIWEGQSHHLAQTSFPPWQKHIFNDDQHMYTAYGPGTILVLKSKETPSLKLQGRMHWQ